VPKVVNKNRNFAEATKGVFEKSISGPLANRSVNYNAAEHRAYNVAVDELLDAFLARNKIAGEEMTPAQARDFVQNVITSSDHRISAFVVEIKREVMRYIRRYGSWRRGGGDED
jgi:hypothetical protein